MSKNIKRFIAVIMMVLMAAGAPKLAEAGSTIRSPKPPPGQITIQDLRVTNVNGLNICLAWDLIYESSFSDEYEITDTIIYNNGATVQFSYDSQGVSFQGVTGINNITVYIECYNDWGWFDNSESIVVTISPGNSMSVITSSASNIATNSAKLNGSFSGNSGSSIDYGFYWGTTNNPTTKVSKGNSSAATLNFIHDLPGLSPDTTYYFKAYAGTAVGEVVSFITPTALTAPTGLTAGTVTDISIALTWNAVPNATNYDIEYNGTVKNVTATSYTLTGLTPNTAYTIKIMAKNASTTSSWSSGISKTTLLAMPSVEINVTKNSEYSFVFTVNDITSFTGKTFKIKYDPAKLTLVDFAAQTKEPDTALGNVKDTDLNIIYNSNGEIIFEKSLNLAQENAWSGLLTIVKFSAKETCATTINFDQDAVTPTASPRAGTYAVAQNVTLSCATSGAIIRYTTDNTEPTSTSTQYTVPILVSSTTTIKAKTFKSGIADGNTVSFTYTIAEQVAAPTANPVTGTYTGTQNVTLSCAASEVTIRYTTNGAEPTSSSTIYSSPISVSATTTIKAKAFKSGMIDSNTASFLYTITAQVAAPTASPGTGTYAGTQNVTLSCATSGATIRYTTNGTEPTSSSTLYTQPISVSTTTTVKAKAFKSGMTDSNTASFTYTITAQPVYSVSFGQSHYQFNNLYPVDYVSVYAYGKDAQGNPIAVTSITIGGITYTSDSITIGVDTSNAPSYYTISAIATFSDGTVRTAYASVSVDSILVR